MVDKGLSSNNKQEVFKLPSQFTCDGIVFPGSVVRQDLKEMVQSFECRNDDVFVVSYPRSGTTWTIEMISLIMNNADTEYTYTVKQHVRVPMLEISVETLKRHEWLVTQILWLKSWIPRSVQRYFKLDKIQDLAIRTATDSLQYLTLMPSSSPRLIKTHLQRHHFPEQGFKKQSKIVYVARNPKDVLVSYYYHYTNTAFHGFYRGTWTDFYGLIMAKQVAFGDWFDHVLGWWKHADDENVCFLKYEEAKKDLRGTIKKLANFLKKDLTEEEIGRIEKYCSFESMRKNPAVNMDGERLFDLKRAAFIRKGCIGDWQNYFTVAQNREFEELYETKMKGSGLSFEW
ncbi:sulfotransferase 1 family member D1-like [Glandiceps talaboti]